MAFVDRFGNVRKYQGLNFEFRNTPTKKQLQYTKEVKLMHKAEFQRAKKSKQAMDALMHPTQPKNKTLKQLIAEGKTFCIYMHKK